MEQIHYIFVITPLKVLCDLPKEILPGYVLQRATKSQIPYIKDSFKHAHLMSSILEGMYETVPLIAESSKPHSYFFSPLPEHTWRYFMIEHRGKNTELENLQYATNLLDVEFQLGMKFSFTPSFSLSWFGGTHNYLQEMSSRFKTFIA